jgi:hypothetical protein
VHRVEITFGHREVSGEPLPPTLVESADEAALQTFSSLYGGGQRYRRIGGYLTTDGRLLLEPCTVIWAYTPSVDEHLPELMELAQALAVLLNQESVLLTVTPVAGVVRFIPPPQYDALP